MAAQRNVNNVLSFDMSPIQKAAIERTKMGLMDGQLEARPFTACCAMNFCWGHDPVYDEKWAPWIEPLLEQPLFKGVETLATETPCATSKRVGGSLDFLLRDDNRIILEDLKAVSSRKESPADASPLPSSRRMGASLQCITLRWW